MDSLIINENNTPSLKLYHQSCFDFLKTLADNSVSLVCIDPPYAVSRDTNFASGERKGKERIRTGFVYR